RCAPVFRGALHDYWQRPQFLSPNSLCLIAALLGEISGPEALDELVHFMDDEDHDIFVHAHWGAWRLGRRYPAQVLAFYSAAIPPARIPQLALIARELPFPPAPPGLSDALLATLDRLPEFANNDDAPFLLAIVVYALAELGLEDEAAEAVRVRQYKLSAKGRN